MWYILKESRKGQKTFMDAVLLCTQTGAILLVFTFAYLFIILYCTPFALTIGGNVSITCHTESPKESSASDRIAFMNSIGISSEKMQCILNFEAILLGSKYLSAPNREEFLHNFRHRFSYPFRRMTFQ